MHKGFISLILFFIITTLIDISLCLDPGMYKRNTEERVRQFQEQILEERKPSILHSLNALGESYMDLMKYVNDNILVKIQNHLSLVYYLTKKQTELEYLNSGFNQNLYSNDLESEDLSDYEVQTEHRSPQFRMVTEQELQKEREKNKFEGRHFDHKQRILNDPLIRTVDEDINYEEIQKEKIARILVNENIPKEDEYINFKGDEKCSNNSYVVVVRQTTYFCNGLEVQETDYKLMTQTYKDKYCAEVKLKYESCLCPLDVIGKRCEFETRIYCEFETVNKQQCPEYNEFEYVSQFSGLPPCVPVSEYDLVNYELKLNCKNAIKLLQEPKVYQANSDYEILWDERPNSVRKQLSITLNQTIQFIIKFLKKQKAEGVWKKFDGFKYYIESDGFVLSRKRRFMPQVQYVNWNVLGESVKDSYEQKYTLSDEQLLGKKSFNVALNFRNLNQNITTSGRYTVEFNIFEELERPHATKFVLSASSVIMLVFEQSKYVEPKIKKINKTFVVSLVILCLVLVIGVTLAIYCFIKQRNQKRRRRQSYEDQSLSQNLNSDASPNRNPALLQFYQEEQDDIQQD